jgi:hypothetical protein
VTGRFAGPVLGLVFVLGGGIRARALAQVAPNRATAYLMPTDVGDVRALWVNPAGLAAREEAAVLLDLTVQGPGSGGRLAQVSTGFNARGLAFGYQRDNFTNGIHGHTYRLGLGGASRGLAFGVGVALYRGATGGTGWDFGIRYDWRPQLTIGGAVRNVGKPTVRGQTLEATFVPSITARPLGDWLALSAQAEATSSAIGAYAVEAHAVLPGARRLVLLTRLDTDRALHRRALVFGLGFGLGHTNSVGVVSSFPGGGAQQNVLSAYGVSTRTPVHRR